MRNLQHYYIDGYRLTVRPESYLVEVRLLGEEPPGMNRMSELPEWAFNSRLAIWLTTDERPLPERAVLGDQIRKLLYSRYLKERIAAG